MSDCESLEVIDMEAEISEAIADAAKDENALKVRTPGVQPLFQALCPPPPPVSGFDSDFNQKYLRKESLGVLFPCAVTSGGQSDELITFL